VRLRWARPLDRVCLHNDSTTNWSSLELRFKVDMTRHAPLLHFTVQHDYYADGLARGLRFEPSVDTQRWLVSHGCLCRANGAELWVYAPVGVDRAEASLCWQVYSEAPEFVAVSEGLNMRAGKPLLLAGPAVADGSSMLDDGAYVLMVENRLPQGPEISAGQESTSHSLRRLMLLTVPAPHAMVHYRARLAARATVWRYWLMGPWPEEDLHVVDPSDTHPVQFGPGERMQLGDQGLVPTFRSLAPVVLRERQDARFQLCSGSASARRVLIKTLPMADVSVFNLETLDGVSTWVSAIYVYR
jgi:hypothetical protein